MGKVRDYLKEIDFFDNYDTEEEAIDSLIASHKRQREMIGAETKFSMHLARHHRFLNWIYWRIYKKVYSRVYEEMGKNG